MASNTVCFLGYRFFIGTHETTQQADEIREKLLDYREELQAEALEKFEAFRSELVERKKNRLRAPRLKLKKEFFAERIPAIAEESAPVATKKSAPVAAKKREPVATKKSAKIEPPVWLQNHDNAKVFDLADLEGTNVRYDHVDETGRAVKNPFIHFRRASTEMWWCAGTPELVYTPHFNMFLVAVPESEVGECLAKYGLIMPAPAPAPAPAPTPAPVEEPNIEDRVDLPSRKGLFTRVDGLVIDLDKCEFFDYAARGDDKHPWVTVYDENDDWVINGRMINE